MRDQKLFGVQRLGFIGSEIQNAGMPLTDEVMMRAVSACVSAPREASEVDDSGVPPGGTRGARGCNLGPFGKGRGTQWRPLGPRPRAQLEARAALLRPLYGSFQERGSAIHVRLLTVRLCVRCALTHVKTHAKLFDAL